MMGYGYHRQASVGSASTLPEVSSGVLGARMTDHVVVDGILPYYGITLRLQGWIWKGKEGGEDVSEGGREDG